MNISCYIEHFKTSLTWALDDSRPAWQRALEVVKNNNEAFKIDELTELKEEAEEEILEAFTFWLDKILDMNLSEQELKTFFLPPEELWLHISCFNVGIFSLNDDPLAGSHVRLRSFIREIKPFVLTNCADGWGMREEDYHLY